MAVTYTAGFVGMGTKVHLALGGVPNCPGVRRQSRVSPLVAFGDGPTPAQHKAAVLAAAGVKPDSVCRACLGRVADLMATEQ